MTRLAGSEDFNWRVAALTMAGKRKTGARVRARGFPSLHRRKFQVALTCPAEAML